MGYRHPIVNPEEAQRQFRRLLAQPVGQFLYNSLPPVSIGDCKDLLLRHYVVSVDQGVRIERPYE